MCNIEKKALYLSGLFDIDVTFMRFDISLKQTRNWLSLMWNDKRVICLTGMRTRLHSFQIPSRAVLGASDSARPPITVHLTSKDLLWNILQMKCTRIYIDIYAAVSFGIEHYRAIFCIIEVLDICQRDDVSLIWRLDARGNFNRH